MEIIDAQIHDVHPVTDWNDLSPGQATEAGIELAIAALDAVEVDAAVVNSLLPTVRSYVERYPGRFAGLPVAGPQVPLDGEVEDLIGQVRATPGMVGVRLIIGYPLDGSRVDDLRKGLYEPYFAAAERHRLPVFVLAHGFLPELHPVLEAHPELTMVIDHLGLHTPPLVPASPDLFDDVPAVVELARYPNVAVKLSGAPSLSLQSYPFEDLWPHLHRIIDAFGVDRLMWGSDFTRCRGLHSYREAVDFLLLTEEISTADKEMLFSGTLRKWLGWRSDAVA